jgi:hypothetical protein
MKDDQTIKVGFCVAYDWQLLKTSLPLVYSCADRICLSLDKDRVSWAGVSFPFDEEAFFSFIAEFDKNKKIAVYEDDFHQASLSPMQNEVRQRNRMAAFLGEGGWHIQLDADEYVIDFNGLVRHLQTLTMKRPTNINCIFYNLFKKVSGGYLLIMEEKDSSNAFFPVATQKPVYEYGRRNGNFNYKSTFGIIHQTWARTDGEIRQKISNWGHKEDFDVDRYFQFWKGITIENYRDIRNFHPIRPESWRELKFVPGENPEQVIEYLQKEKYTETPSFRLQLENNIWYSRFRAAIHRLTIR